MTRRVDGCLSLAVLVLTLGATSAVATPRTLTFEDRVAAQKAIERVYFSHQIGATQPFEKAVSRAALETKVRRYLQESVTLEKLWKSPITSEMLAAELDRIAAATRFPDRLVEVYHALADDPFLIAECVTRPALADRLVRSFFSQDERLRGTDLETLLDNQDAATIETRIRAVGSGGRPLPLPNTGGVGLSPLLPPDDLWDNADLDDVPDPRYDHVAVWTGSLMLVWGGWPSWYTTAQVEGARYDPLTDTWSPMTTVGEPIRRNGAVGVWTGSRMIVWGATAMASA